MYNMNKCSLNVIYTTPRPAYIFTKLDGINKFSPEFSELLRKHSMKSYIELRTHKRDFYWKKDLPSMYSLPWQWFLTAVTYVAFRYFSSCCYLCLFFHIVQGIENTAHTYNAINECWSIQISFKFMKLVTTL